MLRTFFVIWFSVVTFALSAQESQPQPKANRTKISGRVSNVIASQVSLTFFKDMISQSEETYQVPIQGNNGFAMSFQLNEATQVVFEYMGSSLKLFLEPGEELFIQFDAPNFRQSVRFSGEASLQNNYLLQTYKMYDQWDEQAILYEMTQRSPMDFKRFLDRQRHERWGFYKGHPERSKFSEAFRYYVCADIDYWWAYYLLRYRIEHFSHQGIDKAIIPNEYYSFLEEVLISNDRALTNPYYLYFLDKYLTFREEEAAAMPASPISIRVDVPSIFVLSQPEQPPIVTEVKKGARMRFLNEKSTFKSKVLIKDALHEDYWYKVKTGDGHVGWAIGVGLIFENEAKSGTTKDSLSQSDITTFDTAKKYLRGNAMYYMMANDLYWRSRITPVEQLKKEVEEFTMINPVGSYDRIVKNTLSEVSKDSFPEPIFGATNYRIVEAPNIGRDAAPEDVVAAVVIDKEDANLKAKAASEKEAQSVLESIYSMILDADPNKIVEDVRVASDSQAIAKKAQPVRVNEFIDIPLRKGSRPKSPISIGGKIEGWTGRVCQLVIYTDPITFTEEAYELKIKGDYTFETNIELAEPSIGYLMYGDVRVPVFLEPGNQLQLTFHAAHFQKTLHFSGKGSVQNNYLIAQRKFFKDQAAQLQKQMKDADEVAFKKYMDEQRQARLDFLQKYIDNYDLSFSFTNYSIADIDYWYGYNLLNYPWEHPLYHDQDAPMEMTSGYFDFLKNMTISQENALPNQHYTYFLSTYFDYLAELPENQGMTDMELAQRELQGDVLDYYKCKLYSIACKRGKAKAVGPAIKKFIANCNNETYNDVLRMAYNEARGLTNGAPAPLFSLRDINGNLVSLDDYKGKIVYLDFWATWCSPCIMQMRNSRSWKANFKDRDVVFIYVSLDKNSNDWKRHVKNNQLEGIHLIADSGNVYQSRIARSYHVKRLPAVFLLNKQGNIHYNSSKDKTYMRLSEMIHGLLLSN